MHLDPQATGPLTVEQLLRRQHQRDQRTFNRLVAATTALTVFAGGCWLLLR